MIKDGPFRGNTTPNLNGEGKFLRGGPDNLVGQMEEDTIQNHEHVSDDNPDKVREVSQSQPVIFLVQRNVLIYTYIDPEDWCTDGNGGKCSHRAGPDGHSDGWPFSTHEYDAPGSGKIKSGTARYGEETKPTNMRVIYIMKIL